MNVLIIFAHPNENSFGAALLQKLIDGLKEANHQVKLQDLYRDEFRPKLSKEELLDSKKIETDQLVIRYRNEIDWADVIVLLHPSYWYGPPAILKGYFDRILIDGFAFDYVIDHPEPKFTNKKGVLIQTFDAEEAIEKKQFDDITFKSVYYTWKYCGIEEWTRFSFFRVNFVSNNKREEWLEQIYDFGKKMID